MPNLTLDKVANYLSAVLGEWVGSRISSSWAATPT